MKIINLGGLFDFLDTTTQEQIDALNEFQGVTEETTEAIDDTKKSSRRTC